MDYLIHLLNRINLARVRTINFNQRSLLFRKIDGNLTKSKQFAKHTVFPVNNSFLNLEKSSQQSHCKFQVQLEARVQPSIHFCHQTFLFDKPSLAQDVASCPVFATTAAADSPVLNPDKNCCDFLGAERFTQARALVGLSWFSLYSKQLGRGMICTSVLTNNQVLGALFSSLHCPCVTDELTCCFNPLKMGILQSCLYDQIVCVTQGC